MRESEVINVDDSSDDEIECLGSTPGARLEVRREFTLQTQMLMQNAFPERTALSGRLRAKADEAAPS
jgi:hypothetical protein